MQPETDGGTRNMCGARRSRRPEPMLVLEDALRNVIRKRVIEIGTTQAIRIVRRRTNNSYSARDLRSMYSLDDSRIPSVKALMAVADALDCDPLGAVAAVVERRRDKRVKHLGRIE